MATLKLYGGRMGSSLRCHWTLEEAGAEYESVPVNMKEREHKQPKFLKLNPNGQVPVLIDGDFVLTESIAINHYIAEKFKPSLAGSTPVEKALVLQWGLWSGFNLQRYFGMLTRHHWTGVKDEKTMAEAKENLDRFIAVLEGALKEKGFLVGDHFTLADINASSVFTYNDRGDYDMSPYENTRKWLTSLRKRPSFKAARAEA